MLLSVDTSDFCWNLLLCSTPIETAVEDVRKKKKKVPHTLSVTSMLRKFQREKERQRQKLDKANPRRVAALGTPTIPLCPADAAGGGGSGLADPLLTLIGSTNDHALLQAASAVDFDIDLDTLLDANEETFSPSLAPQPPKGTQLPQVTTDPTHTTASSDADPQPSNRKITDPPRPSPESEAKAAPLHPYSPLPEGLPPELEGNIQKLLVVRSNDVLVSTLSTSVNPKCSPAAPSRLPRPQRENLNSSSSPQKSTQSCLSKLSDCEYC